MPAIQLDKLKLQTANLAGKFGQPEDFQQDLLELFEFYTNRTFRAGTNTLSNRLAASYHLPERVLWQIERDLEPQINVYAQDQSLALAELLWRGDSMEEKTLAVFILGQIPVENDAPVLEQFQRWFQPGLESALRLELVTTGLRRLRRERFSHWMEMIQQWIASSSEEQSAQAYLALVELLQETGDAHLPSVSRLMREIILVASPQLHPELLSLFKVMVQTSLIETSFLMQEVLQQSNPRSSIHKRLLRKMIQLFPEESQMEMKRQYLEHFRAA